MSLIVKQTQKELRTRIIDALGRAVANGELPGEIIPDFNIESRLTAQTVIFPQMLRLQELRRSKKRRE